MSGRPHTLTESKRTELCSLIAAGLPLRDAARHVGCHVRTIRREQQHDDDFRRAFGEAELSARLEPERMLRKAAATHWRAAAWLLDRTRRRGPARSTPAATLPEDLQALSDVLIEAMLIPLKDPAARRKAYDNLAAISTVAMAEILSDGGQALRRRTITPLTDSVQLNRDIERHFDDRVDRKLDGRVDCKLDEYFKESWNASGPFAPTAARKAPSTGTKAPAPSRDSSSHNPIIAASNGPDARRNP